jgi:hypothetical protein
MESKLYELSLEKVNNLPDEYFGMDFPTEPFHNDEASRYQEGADKVLIGRCNGKGTSVTRRIVIVPDFVEVAGGNFITIEAARIKRVQKSIQGVYKKEADKVLLGRGGCKGSGVNISAMFEGVKKEDRLSVLLELHKQKIAACYGWDKAASEGSDYTATLVYNTETKEISNVRRLK